MCESGLFGVEPAAGAARLMGKPAAGAARLMGKPAAGAARLMGKPAAGAARLMGEPAANAARLMGPRAVSATRAFLTVETAISRMSSFPRRSSHGSTEAAAFEFANWASSGA